MLNIGSMCTGARVIAVSPALTSAIVAFQAVAYNVCKTGMVLLVQSVPLIMVWANRQCPLKSD